MAARAAINIQIDKRELDRVIGKIDAYAKRVSKSSTKTKIMRKAAKPVIKTAKSLAAKSEEKVIKFYRHGGVLAEIHRGDLRRSIGVKKFKRDPSIYVGPILRNRKDARGIFKGRRTWAYMMFWVEYGTTAMPPQPYMRPAAKRSAPAVLRILQSEYKKLANAV